MSPSGLLQLGASVVIFVLAASGAKAWALAPSMPKMVLTLGLYTLGNVIIMRLVRESGMSVALSLSGVLQLVAVNAIAFSVFGERVGWAQGWGIALAVVAVALITLGPSWEGRP